MRGCTVGLTSTYIHKRCYVYSTGTVLYGHHTPRSDTSRSSNFVLLRLVSLLYTFFVLCARCIKPYRELSQFASSDPTPLGAGGSNLNESHWSKPQIKGGGGICVVSQWPDPKKSTQPNFSRKKKTPAFKNIFSIVYTCSAYQSNLTFQSNLSQ